MSRTNGNKTPEQTMEENLKKALTETLILRVLSEREAYIGEVTQAISDRSGGTLNIVFPYAAIYRLLDEGYIEECKKRVAPDGRRRQYLRVTKEGIEYMNKLIRVYLSFTGGVSALLAKED